MSTLVAPSLAVITAGQHASGAYVAALGYPTYQYAWLRDGAYCAYAMDLHGANQSAAAFHRFVGRTLLAHRARLEAPVTETAHQPPTRFTLDGRSETDADESWPSNFQLDGYGAWLWALHDHLRRGGMLGDGERGAAALVSGYLQRTADLPCFDCWEELGDQRHTSTVVAVIAGLRAAGDMLDDRDAETRADDLLRRLLERHVVDGSLVKFEGTDAVDASLLWAALPFGILDASEPRMARTAARITAELVGPTGGLRRYAGDSFYGGGEWTLLTAWLGWYEAVTGHAAAAQSRREWIEACATPAGHLPEQRLDAPQAPEMVQHWIDAWGPVATPLLWSHAMYLVLVAAQASARSF
jgi:isomaltose glucohydrolase